VAETRREFHDETAATIVAAAMVACQWWIMAELHVAVRLALPLAASALALAVVFMLFMPGRGARARRGLHIALVAIFVVADFFNVVALAGQALFGQPDGAIDLLFAGFVLWTMNVFVFALAYWILDGGGPERRGDGGFTPDWVFPQQTDSVNSPEGWAANFADYLYLAFTGAIAFGPTDAMPYTNRAKGVMTLEAITALATLGVIIARAVALAD
jgi:hypothetical protein